MPDFVPFRALRYGADAATTAATESENVARDLTRVCSPPYDVIEPEDRAALLGADRHNMVRLILPDAYDEAAATLTRWRDDGVLVLDERASFSVYRMTFTGDDGARTTTTGVIGALALDPGAVLPHERTLPKAKSDRLELLRATRANLEPVWGISLAVGLSTLLAPTGEPLARADDGEGGVHELWRVDDPDTVAAIRAAVSGDSVVLADGHHRYETSCTYRDERAADGIDDRGAGFIMILVVELADDQLCVRAIHRLLHGVEGVDLRSRLAPWFTVRDAGPNTPDRVTALEASMHADGGLGLVDHAGLALLVPRPELDDKMAELPAPLRDVDSARFDTGVLAALAGPTVAGATLAYRNDARSVAAQVAKGAADAAVLLRPVTVATIRAAAAAGVRMPEKTTFFAPKPRTGMVLRAFDDATGDVATGDGAIGDGAGADG